MAQLTPRFSANRAVAQYTEERYLPAAASYRQRVANNGELGKQIVAWQHELAQKWNALHFGEKKVETQGDQHRFEVQVFLNDLDPKAVKVELYADAVPNGASVRQEMQQNGPVTDAPGSYLYSASVAANRPPTDYTARVIPHQEGVAIPLEDARILWQN